MKSLSFHTSALLADSINDVSSTRKVYLLAAGLAVLGVALIWITVWFWRSTRHDPELLGPLEVMGARRFRRLDGGAQQAVLDESRPAEATPMRWGVVRGGASADGEIDLRANARSAPDDYDDLRDPALIAVAREQVPEDDSRNMLVPSGARTAAATPAPAVVQVGQAKLPANPDGGASDAAGVADVADVAGDKPLLRNDADIDAVLAAGSVPEDSDAAVAALAPDDAPPDLHPGDAAATRTVIEDAPADDDGAPSATDDEPVVADAIADRDVPVVDDDADAAALPERGRPRGSKPMAAQPLVIVPIDHELRPSSQAVPVIPAPRQPAPAPVASEPEIEPETVADATEDAPASIDPLLRMFDRNET